MGLEKFEGIPQNLYPEARLFADLVFICSQGPGPECWVSRSDGKMPNDSYINSTAAEDNTEVIFFFFWQVWLFLGRTRMKGENGEKLFVQGAFYGVLIH